MTFRHFGCEGCSALRLQTDEKAEEHQSCRSQCWQEAAGVILQVVHVGRARRVPAIRPPTSRRGPDSYRPTQQGLNGIYSDKFWTASALLTRRGCSTGFRQTGRNWKDVDKRGRATPTSLMFTPFIRRVLGSPALSSSLFLGTKCSRWNDNSNTFDLSALFVALKLVSHSRTIKQ